MLHKRVWTTIFIQVQHKNTLMGLRSGLSSSSTSNAPKQVFPDFALYTAAQSCRNRKRPSPKMNSSSWIDDDLSPRTKKTHKKKQNSGSSVKTLKWELYSSWPAADQKKQTSWRAAFWLLLRCPWARQRHFQSALIVSRFTLSSLFACPHVCVSILCAVCRGEWKLYFIVLYQQ